MIRRRRGIVAEAGRTLASLIRDPSVTPRGLAECLNGLSLAERIAAVRSLSGRRVQAALWRLAAANPEISVADLVPRDYAPMRPVVFHGKNSLPAFTHFEKICCRPPSSTHADVLWGYNATHIRKLIGPGYYVVQHMADNPFGGAAFDYRSLPDAHPPGWPPIRANSVGLSRFVYNDTVDYMRRLADEVFIGSATRNQRELGNFFILVRQFG